MASETKEQKEKRELIYFRERARSRKQIWQVCKSLCWFLTVSAIGYFVFVCAIIGAQNMHFGVYSKTLQTLLWGLSIIWLMCGAPFFSVYQPIVNDADKWLTIVAKRLKAAKEAWGKADNKIKVSK